MSDYSNKCIPGTQWPFSDKVAPDIDGSFDELMGCLSLKNYFVHGCK